MKAEEIELDKTYYITIKSGQYGYHRPGLLPVTVHFKSTARIKCSFVVASGKEVHRWLNPSTLTASRDQVIRPGHD